MVVWLLEALCYKPECGGFDSQWGHWNFSLTQSFWPHYSPGAKSTSNRNEYQEYLLAGTGRPMHRADNLTTFMCILSRNSESLNLLDPERPAQMCNGTAFFFLCFWLYGCILYWGLWRIRKGRLWKQASPSTGALLENLEGGSFTGDFER